MSVILVGPRGSLGLAVFERMSGQGDDVRVIEDDEAAAQGWRKRGGYVALAREWDADLIERASYEGRTIVLFDRDDRPMDELLEATLQAAAGSSVDRIILVQDQATVPAALHSGGPAYVVLGVGKRSRLRRTAPVPDDLVARAVDAADDLSGSPRLALDLTRSDDRRKLELEGTG